MAVQLQRRLFTSAEFRRMAEAGVFGPDERVELLDGEIVEMSPISSAHAWCVKRLTAAFGPLFGRIILGVQDPLHLGERSDPEPDLTIIRAGTSQADHPGPADVLLVIEVASSSIAVDRDIKAPLYARAGIQEYWVVDLNRDRIEVRRTPTPDGYATVQVLGRGQRISPLFAPDFEIEVAAILGPAAPAE